MMSYEGICSQKLLLFSKTNMQFIYPKLLQADVDKQVFFQSTPKSIEISKQFLTGYSEFRPKCHGLIKEQETQGKNTL